MSFWDYVYSKIVTLCFWGIGALLTGVFLAFADVDISFITMVILSFAVQIALWLLVSYLLENALEKYITSFLLERIKNQVEPYWVCLPMATRTALSSYEMYWYPWDDTKKVLWVREMPQKEYVINLENNKMTTYRYRMHQEDLAKQFGRWYRDAHNGGKTVCLLGMRADESLQHYRDNGSATSNRYYLL